jgi:hypothetical protein
MSRQIDALVAEHVFGFRPPHARGMRFMPRRYSTDIESAWRVVEKMAAPPTNWTFGVWADGTLQAQSGGESFEISAATAPMAICLAALQAVGVKVEP